MFYSHCLLSRKGPLGSIWVAAYCYNKLRKTQVTSTDIPSSVDRILEDESDLITYRILAFMLLGIVRIYSKKVEYLFDDCNKVLLNIKDFVLKNKDETLMEAPCASYFSITLPERFELDTFDLEIMEDISCRNVVSLEEITLKDTKWKTGESFMKCFADQYGYEDFASSSDTFSDRYVLSGIGLSSHEMDFEMEQAISKIQASTDKLHCRVSRHGCVDARTSSAVGDGHPGPSKSFGEEHETVMENAEVPEAVDMGEMHAETSKQKSQGDSVSKVACAGLETFGGAEGETKNTQYGEICENGRHQRKDPGVMQSESELLDAIEDRDLGDVNAVIERLLYVSFSQEERMDIQSACEIQEPTGHTRPVHEDYQSGDENSLSWNSHCHTKKDEGIPVKLDATPPTTVHDVIEKPLDVSFSEVERMDIQTACAIQEPPGNAQPVNEDCHTGDENSLWNSHCHTKKDEGIPVKLDATPHTKVHDVNAVIEMLLDVNFPQEERMDIQTACAVQEPQGNARPVHEDCQTGDEKSLSQNSHSPAKKDEGIPVKLDATPQTKVYCRRGKLWHLDVSFSLEERMDIQTACAVQEPQGNARPVPEDCQTGDENSLSQNSHCPAKKDEGIPVKLDATPQTKVYCRRAAAPEPFALHTPATKERARNQKKRKCFFDDVIVFPNNVIKQILRDSSDLVRKRKVPRTVLAAWKEHRLSSASRCFLDPLIPSASLDLSTFLCKKNGNAKDSLKTLEVPRRLVYECPPIVDQANVPESPAVARIVEDVRPAEQVDMLISVSTSTNEVPQEYVSECSNADKFVESVEHQEKAPIPESLVGGTKSSLGPLETLRASDSATGSRFVETVGPPGELDIPQYPAAPGVEQGEIAPDTPIRHTPYPRSFESPDGPDMSYDGDVDKQPCLYKDQELDFCLLNEETNSCEEDGNYNDNDNCGWSERSRVAMRCLHRSFLLCKERGVNEVIDLPQLLEGRTAKESARLFSEILVLKSKGYVNVKQDSAYGRLLVWKTSQWDQGFGVACK